MTRIVRMLTAASILLGAGMSYGQVIDFEGIAPPGDVAGPFIDANAGPYFEDGLALFGTTEENAIFDSTAPDAITNGSDVFGWCGDCGSIIQILLIADIPPAFDLLSVDATDWLFQSEIAGNPGDLEIEGIRANFGGSVFATFDLTDSWTTFMLPDTFTNLEFVIITASAPGVRSLGIDNLVFEPVPVPAAVWLFGSGLIGLVLMARRKKS